MAKLVFLIALNIALNSKNFNYSYKNNTFLPKIIYNTNNIMSTAWTYEPHNPEFRTPTSNKIISQKPLYNSMMPQQLHQARMASFQDKKLIKQLIKYFSENTLNCNVADPVSRILNFNTHVQDIELENIGLTNQLTKYKQDVITMKGQIRNLSASLKEKDDSMLILKGKLYEKDESLKELNHKLNKIIEAIESTPNQECSFSIQDIPKLVIQEQNEQDMSLTIPDIPNETSIKLVELEAENKSLKNKLLTMESEINERSKQSSISQQLEKTVVKLNSLTFEKREIELKFQDCERQIKRLRQQNIKTAAKISQSLGCDQIQQLRLSIRQLQQKVYNKTKQSQVLISENSRLKQSDKMYRDKIEEVNRVNNIFNEQRRKIENLINENRYEIEKLIKQNHMLRAENSKLVLDIALLKREIEKLMRHTVNNLNGGFNHTMVDSKRQEELVKKNKQLENKLEQLKINMEEFQHRHGNEIRALESRIMYYQNLERLKQAQQ